jgi:hypothetical protein
MANSPGQQAVSDATKKKNEASVADLKNLFEKFKSARKPFEPDWFLNSAFFVGQQWLYWNHGRLDRPRLAKYRETIVDNRILPLVTARVAKKVKSRPNFVATPFTGSESDVDAAKVTEKVMQFDWTYLDLQQKLYQAELFADIVGAGFWKIYWDSSLGDKAEVVVDAQGQPVEVGGRILKAEDVGEEGLPEGLSVKEVAVGDVCVDVVSPFHFYPDPLATSMSELTQCFEEKVRSPDYVKERFGVDLQPDTEAPAGPVESRIFSSLMPGTGTGYKGVKLYEFWSKPCASYPNGKRAVWAKDQMLSEEDNPVDPMPYVMFSGVKVPNRFWPTAIATQLRGPQIALNKLESQVQENANRLGNPSLLKSRQANVFYGGVPGEEVLYDSTVSDAVPQFLTPPNMPTYVLERAQRIIESMNEISGLHEVSNASVPTGVTAASAINLLQEADDTRIGPEVQDMEFALGQAGTKVVRLRAKFNSDERLMRIAGEDESWDIFNFRGTMMGKEPTVECQAGSAMPRSKAAKQAAMLEVLQTMFQYGLVPDQRDLRKFFNDYEVGALDRLFGGLSVTEQQIQRENRELAQGNPVPINAYDQDQEHIDGHEEFQRSARYGQLPPEIRQVVEQHVGKHRQRMVGQANMQIEAQAQAQQAQLGQEHGMRMEEKAGEAALDAAKQHAAPEPHAPVQS